MATTERIYRLTVEAGQAVRELQKLNSSVEGIDKKFGALGASLKGFGVAMAASFSVDAVIGGLKRVIDSVDQMADKAEALGLMTDKLQEFNYAAQQSGSSAEGIEKGLTFLSRSIAENDKAFSAMGVSIKQSNGELKSTDQVLLAVADKFSGYRDGAEKVALATALFGKEGAKLIPFLNQGAEGLTKLGNEARKAGAVVGEDAIRSIKDFNDNLDALGSRVLAFTANALGPLLKWLNDTISHFNRAAEAAGGFFGAMSLNAETNLNRIFRDSATLAKRYSDELNRLSAVEAQRAKDGLGQSEANQARIKQLQFLIELEGKRAAQQSGQKFEPEAPTTPTIKPPAPIVPSGGDGKPKISDAARLAAEETKRYGEELAKVLFDIGKINSEIASGSQKWSALTDWISRGEAGLRKMFSPAREAEIRKQLAALGQSEAMLAAIRQAEKDDAAVQENRRKNAESIGEQTRAFEAMVLAIKKSVDPTIELSEAYDNLELAFERGAISLAVYNKRYAQLEEQSKKVLGAITPEIEKVVSVSSILNDNFNSFFNNMQNGVANAKEAFERMAQSILIQLARLAASKLFDRFFGPGTSWDLPKPSGLGGSKSFGSDIAPKSLSIRSVPQSGVLKAGSDPQQFVSGSAAPQVTVINNAGAEIGVESRQNADGSSSIEILVERKVKGMIASGAMDRVMANTFGARRRGFA